MLRDPGRSFFVVANTALNGDRVRVDTPDGERASATHVNMFDRSQFPVCLVAVVGVQTRLRTFFEYPEWHPWWSQCVPSGIRTLVSQFLGEGEIVCDELVGIKPWLTIVDDVEAAACGYEALWVSERAVASAPHSFLTSGERDNYQAVACRVHLHVSVWADLPRCFATFDQLYVPRNLSEMDRSVRDYHEKRRSAFCEKARANGPHVGSFIPCSLCYGFDLWESECVLEITGDPEPEGRTCVLHILSDTETPGVRPKMQLRTTVEVGHKRVVTNLGQIVD